MIDHLLPIATILAVLGSGLIAGAFFAFAAFVLPALSRLPAPAGIAAMQSIIAAIKGPLFLVVFFGTAALAGLLGLAAPLKWGEPGAMLSADRQPALSQPPVRRDADEEPAAQHQARGTEARQRRGQALLGGVPRHLGPVESRALDRRARRGGRLHPWRCSKAARPSPRASEPTPTPAASPRPRAR